MNIKRLLIALYLLPLAFLASCTQDAEIPASENPESYLVHLNLSGEINVTTEPLSRGTATSHIYGINVYYDKEKDGNPNDIFAYGLFNNTEDMTISLLSGYTYRFDCTLVKNGQQKLYYGAYGNNSASGFLCPFTKSSSTFITNAFVIGTSAYLTEIKKGAASLVGSTTAVGYPSLERYYGETTGYTPTKNGSVNIYLRKAYFGARFVVKGMKTGERLSLSSAFFSKTYTADDEGEEQIYCFDACPTVDEYYDNFPLYYTLYSPLVLDFSYTGSCSIKFYRNVMTTVTIDVSHPDASLVVTDPGEITNVNNIDLEINTDGVIDTVVNPEDERNN